MTSIAVLDRSGSYRVMGLIGVSHAASHFYHLVVPVLFPVMKDDLGVSYAQLGLLTTLMFVASGIFQPISGIVVDRFGARQTLFAGIALLSGAILLAGLVPSYWMLALLMPIAGVGNSVFHPADYSILSGSIDRSRLGRAYGLHTLGGNLGWAAAPVSMLGLASLFGWRTALIVAGLVGFAILAALLSQSSHLDDGRAAHRALPKGERAVEHTILSVLVSVPVMLCFAYFVFLAVASVGLQSFLPAILGSLHGVPLVVGSAALTGFLIGSSAGTTLSLLFADRVRRHHVLVGLGLAASAAMVVLVSEIEFAPVGLTAVLFVSGFALGMTMPSRDLVVRQATPPGATGRVFGFVYSGLDAGATVVPVAVGLMLDHGVARQSLWMVAAALGLCIVIAIWLQRLSDRA